MPVDAVVAEVALTSTVTADGMVEVVVTADVVVAKLVIHVVMVALTGGGASTISDSDTSHTTATSWYSNI